jgi:uncharacterized short protein YbdD (DUF466 family)
VKRIVTEPRAAAIEATAPPAGARARRARIEDRARAILGACRQVLGIPDYERYLAHMAAHHPQEPVLTRRDFFARAIDRKYGRGGARCC